VVRPMSFILAAALCGLLWWYHGVAAEYALFGGALAHALNVAASLLTAVLLVVLAAEAVIGIGIKILLASEPTGFERAGVYSVLGIAGVAGVLAHFGVDIATVLATSAVLTAIIGLALQPTLGGLIAGFTLHADRVLKVGDAIMQDGEPVIVTSIGWRSISGTKADGGRMVLSNSRILDGTINILPRATSIRTTVTITAPIAVDPQRIARIVSAVIVDLPMVDGGQPVTVTPSVFRPERAQIRYRVRYWVRSHEDLIEVEEKVMTRVWYAFQRDGIECPVPVLSSASADGDWSFDLPSPKDTLSRALADAVARSGVVLPGRLSPEVIAETGILLLYAEDEHIFLPERVTGYDFLLIAGRLRGSAFEWSSISNQSGPAKARSGRSEHWMVLMDITEHLAALIGPYAEFAVQQAASGGADLDVIRHRVAREIDDPIEHDAFLKKTAMEPVLRYGPGFPFTSRVGPAGTLQSDPFLCADGPVSILAIPRNAP
jgi:small-conductance mechanosensitive channel